MQDQDKPTPGRVLDDAQQCVMCVLLAPVGSGICSLRELELAVGDPTTTHLAIAALHADGLVHRLDEFVFATRAAARTQELDVLAALPHP